MSFSYGKTSNVCFTLPITCQICLGKVKEPMVCPNLHAFCAFCIDIWLEKNKQCPTCRIPITNEAPCRRILGGYDAKEDILIPTDFSHSSTRKARFNSLFQQYEEEIGRLLKQIDSLTNEIVVLKEMNNDNVMNPITNPVANSPQHDMIQILKNKIQQMQSNYDDLIKERDKLKDSNKKLESENSLLMQDVQRLKVNINETKAQMTSRYTVAALESKIEIYEKEIKQLQKALEKSDNYVLELENQFKLKNINNLNDFQFIKNELKFNEIQTNSFHKVDNIDLQIQQNGKMTNAISNDKFYGSPIKPAKSNDGPKMINNKNIESFTDRLKKSSFDLELPSPLTQSFNNNVTITEQPTGDFINSPMKRLRLEEFNLEKPKQDLNNSLTSEFNDCLELLNEAETKVNSRSSGITASPKVHRHHNSLLNSSSFTFKPNKQTQIKFLLPDKYHQDIINQQLHQSKQSTHRNSSNENLTPSKYDFTSNDFSLCFNKQKVSPSQPIDNKN